MMNRALLKLLEKEPAACFMHDWWIALTASCFGVIDFVPESLSQYRQHGDNVLGARASGSLKDCRGKLPENDRAGPGLWKDVLAEAGRTAENDSSGLSGSSLSVCGWTMSEYY